jgi:hypothetical protein
MCLPHTEGGDKLLGCDSSCDPFLLRRLILLALKQEVCQRLVWPTGQVAEDLDAMGGQSWTIATMRRGALSQWKNHPCSTRIGRLFLMCPTLAGGPPKDDVCIDDALAVEECQQHLFDLTGMDHGLYWAGPALLYPLLGAVFFI